MGLIRQGAVLGVARLLNFAVMFVTPLLMVRLLDVEAYGQYREFMLYATVAVSVLSLAIKDNLNYFVSVRPEDAARATSQTMAMLLLLSGLGAAVIWLASGWLLARASFDFLWPLLLYTLLVINFDVLENYWLGRQQATPVLVYSTVRVLLRVLSVLLATYLTADVQVILWSLVAAEAIKALICVAVLWRLRLFRLGLDRNLLREQLRFVLPLSGAGLLFFINEKVGHLYISAAAGAAALAIYTVGTYQLPIIAIARSAVADTLFPEMSRHFARASKEGLELWKTANLGYAYVVLPMFFMLFVFAEEFIILLFTTTYLDAVPIFRVALLVMLRQAFEVGTPLRAANRNRYVLWANGFAIVCHIPLLMLLVPKIGVTGAAIAWLAADLVTATYLASRIIEIYEIRLSVLAHWRETGKVILAAVAPLPVLLLAKGAGHPALVVPLAVVAYGAAYLWLVRRMGIPPIDALTDRIRAALIQAVRRRLGRG